MKMFFFCCVAAMLSSSTQAQPNNPYNRAGTDFVKSAQVIASELKKGNIKNADEATISQIQSSIPTKTQMNPSLAGEIMKNIAQNPLPFSSVLKSSSLKPELQREVSMMLEHLVSSKTEMHKAWLTEKAESYLKTALEKDDKEILLTLVAIMYNADQFGSMARIRCNTSVNGRVVNEGEGMECAGAATLIGFTLGYTFCGFYCGLGGALIGFVAVAVGSIS